MKNINKVLVLTSSTLLLGACTSYSLDSIESSAQELDEDVSALVDELNTVFDAESNLHQTFEEDIQADPDLGHFADESAGVFENIEARRSSLSTIEELTGNLSDHAEYLAGYDGEELSAEETNALADQLAQLTEQLTSYIDHYTTSLDQQNDFFTSLGSDDADAETLVNGIESVNEEHSTLVDASLEINQELGDLMTNLDEFQQAVSQAQSSEGE